MNNVEKSLQIYRDISGAGEFLKFLLSDVTLVTGIRLLMAEKFDEFLKYYQTKYPDVEVPESMAALAQPVKEAQS